MGTPRVLTRPLTRLDGLDEQHEPLAAAPRRRELECWVFVREAARPAVDGDRRQVPHLRLLEARAAPEARVVVAAAQERCTSRRDADVDERARDGVVEDGRADGGELPDGAQERGDVALS